MSAARARQQQQQQQRGPHCSADKENAGPRRAHVGATSAAAAAAAAASTSRSVSRTPSGAPATRPQTSASTGSRTLATSADTPASGSSATPVSRPSSSAAPQAAAAAADGLAGNGLATPASGEHQAAGATSLSQCRICRKYISLSEQCHLCSNCNQFICEDCASYSASDQHWMCSSCKRRAANTSIAVDAIKELGLHKDSSPVRRMTIRLNQNELKIAASKIQPPPPSDATAASAQRPMSGTSTSASSASGSNSSGSAPAARRPSPSATYQAQPPPPQPPPSTAEQPQSAQRPIKRAPSATAGPQQPAGALRASDSEPPPLRVGGGVGGARAASSAGAASANNKSLSHPTPDRSTPQAGNQTAAAAASSSAHLQQQHQHQQQQQQLQRLQPHTSPARRASVASPTEFSAAAAAAATPLGALEISPRSRAARRKQSAQQQQQQSQSQLLYQVPFGAHPPRPSQPVQVPIGRLDSRRSSFVMRSQQQHQQQPYFVPPPQTLVTASSDASIENLASANRGAGSRRESLSWTPSQVLPVHVDRSMMRHSDGQLNSGVGVGASASAAAAGHSYSAGHSASSSVSANASTLIPVPPEQQIHQRRLSDQSNLVRRSSIIADTLDGLTLARNRSHSNIDSVTNYFQQQQQLQQQVLRPHYAPGGRSDEHLHHLPISAGPTYLQQSAPPGHMLGVDYAAMVRQRRASDQLDRLQLAKQQQQQQYEHQAQVQQQQQQQRRMSQMSSLITSASQKRRRSSEEIRSDSSSDLDDTVRVQQQQQQLQLQLQQQQIPSVSVSEFNTGQARGRYRQQAAQQQPPLQPAAAAAQDHIMTTPMEINVAIEHAIQMQQQQQQQQYQDMHSLAAHNLASVRRGSSGRILPKIPGEQQSRSMLDLPQHQQQQQQHQQQQQQQQLLHQHQHQHQQHLHQQQIHSGAGATSGAHMMLDLPSPSVRRASAPEGQSIKIVVNDIDGLMMHRGSGAELLSSTARLAQQHLATGAGRDPLAAAAAAAASQTAPPGRRGSQIGDAPPFVRAVLYRDDALEMELDSAMPLANGNCGGRGFGLHVMGGKIEPAQHNNGHTLMSNGFGVVGSGNKALQAYTTWVRPGGPADKAGIRPGDQIIEWDGKCLIDMSYEQVAEVIESSANIAELLVKPTTTRSTTRPLDQVGSQTSLSNVSSTGVVQRGSQLQLHRMSQQLERETLNRQLQQFQNHESFTVTEPSRNRQRRLSGQQLATDSESQLYSRAGTGRKLPQIPPITATDTATDPTMLGYDMGQSAAAAAANQPQQTYRHASTGQLETKGTGASYGDVSAAYFAASNLLSAANEQQSRSASELQGKGALGRHYSNVLQTMTPMRTRTNSTTYDGGSQWLIQQQMQHLAGQQQVMQQQQQPQMMLDRAPLGYPPQPHPAPPAPADGRQAYKNLMVASQHYETRGLIGLEVNVDEHMGSLEITVLAAINVDRDTSLDYCVRVRILPESNQFKPCVTQPSSDLNWDETFLLHNFPIGQAQRMALEVGIWRSNDVLATSRLSTQIAQPICETLIPIQSARERRTNYWPLGPPPTSPQSRRRSLNDLIGTRCGEDPPYVDSRMRMGHLIQVAGPPNLLQQQQAHQWQPGAGRMYPVEFQRSHQHLFSTSTNSPSPSLSRRPSVSHDSPKGSRTPLGLAYCGRERSASNRNLPDTSKFLQAQPRRASDEVASGSSHRLMTRLSPAASRRSISVINVGAGSSSFKATAARIDSQSNLLKAQLARRDSLQKQQQQQLQQQQQQQQLQQHQQEQQQQHQRASALGSTGSTASKYASPAGSVSRDQSATTTATSSAAVGILPSGRRTSLVGMQSMVGYRSQKSSQSDTAPEVDSPIRRSSRDQHQQQLGPSSSQPASTAPLASNQQAGYTMSAEPGLRSSRPTQTSHQSQQQSAAYGGGGERTTSQPVAGASSGGAFETGRRGSTDQSAQQPHPTTIQRKGSFALQTLRKLKRTMSLTKGNDSNTSSQQESRRSSSSSNYSVSEIPEDLGVVRASSSSQNYVGKIKLSLFLSKGQFEVEVISAQGLRLDQDSAQGVYVKTYLRGLSKSNKRKTRVVQPWESPLFKQTIKYDGALIGSNKSLEVSIWMKQNGLRGKLPIGYTEIRLTALDLARPQTSWYNLRSMEGLCSSSIED